MPFTYKRLLLLANHLKMDKAKLVGRLKALFAEVNAAAGNDPGMIKLCRCIADGTGAIDGEAAGEMRSKLGTGSSIKGTFGVYPPPSDSTIQTAVVDPFAKHVRKKGVAPAKPVDSKSDKSKTE